MTNNSEMQCPLCDLVSDKVTTRDGDERITIECKRCGDFTITRTAADFANANDLTTKLSAWTREQTELGIDTPEIDLRSLKSIEAALQNYRVSQKQLLLLRALERRARFPGDLTTINFSLDYPLAWASNDTEFKYLLEFLIDRALLKMHGAASSRAVSVYITPTGWTYIDEYARTPAISDQVFVAMSFADELKNAWQEGILPALSKALFRPYRIDVLPHVDRIDAKIITEIKNSKFLVADVTQQRPGVYFEAGYALGLGLPVFWCVREDELEKVHFDTRQYNHIVWKDEQHLAEQLYYFVISVVGKGSTI